MIRKLHSFFFQGTFFITTLKVRKTGWKHDILLPKFLSNMYFSPGRCHINFVWHYVNPCKYYRKLVECRNGGFSRLLVATSFPISFRPMQGNPDSWIWEIFACGIRNPTENWNSESKFHWQRIRNPVPGIRNPDGVESRIQDCLRFLYVGRIFQWQDPKSLREERHEKLARIFGCIDKPISASFRFILGLEAWESWVALRSRMNNTFLLFYFPNFRLHNR